MAGARGEKKWRLCGKKNEEVRDWKKNERTTKAEMGRLCARRLKSNREDWGKCNGQSWMEKGDLHRRPHISGKKAWRRRRRRRLSPVKTIFTKVQIQQTFHVHFRNFWQHKYFYIKCNVQIIFHRKAKAHNHVTIHFLNCTCTHVSSKGKASHLIVTSPTQQYNCTVYHTDLSYCGSGKTLNRIFVTETFCEFTQ